jgi:hypothetical protein
MNQELLDYLEAHQGDANYASGNAFAYGLNNRAMDDLASGGVPAGLIAPGVSYSQRKPEGYTQYDLASPFGYVDQVAPYMPSGPRYMPMVSDASTFNELAAQYGANQAAAYDSTVGGTTDTTANTTPAPAPAPAPTPAPYVNPVDTTIYVDDTPVTAETNAGAVQDFVDDNITPFVEPTAEEIEAASLLFEQTGYRTEEEALANNYIKGVDGNYYYYNSDPAVLQEIRENDPYNTMYNDYVYEPGVGFNNLDELF